MFFSQSKEKEADISEEVEASCSYAYRAEPANVHSRTYSNIDLHAGNGFIEYRSQCGASMAWGQLKPFLFSMFEAGLGWPKDVCG